MMMIMMIITSAALSRFEMSDTIALSSKTVTSANCPYNNDNDNNNIIINNNDDDDDDDDT